MASGWTSSIVSRLSTIDLSPQTPLQGGCKSVAIKSRAKHNQPRRQNGTVQEAAPYGGQQSTKPSSQHQTGLHANITLSPAQTSNLVTSESLETSDKSQSPWTTGKTPPYPAPEFQKFVLLADRAWLGHTWTIRSFECTNIRSDQQFFKELRQVRNSTYVDKSWITYLAHFARQHFFRVRTINHVKFEIINGTIAKSLESPSVPPEVERENYLPCGRDFDMMPPISSLMLAHLYNHPEHANDVNALMDRIPMKLHNSLVRQHQHDLGKDTTGWGLQYEEQPRINRILTVSMGAELLLWSCLCGSLPLRQYDALDEPPSYSQSLLRLNVFFLGAVLYYQNRERLQAVLSQMRAFVTPRIFPATQWSCEACGAQLTEPSQEASTTADVSQKSTFQQYSASPEEPSDCSLSSSDAGSGQSCSLSLPPPATHSTNRSGAHRPTYRWGNHGDTSKSRTEYAVEEKELPTTSTSRFLICAATGPDHLPRLQEKPITDTLTDQAFFEYLHTLRRPWRDAARPWTWLIGVVAINYVAFEILEGGYVSLLKRPGYAPPARSADYRPCKDPHTADGFRRSPAGSCFHPFPSAILLQKYRRPAAAGRGTYYLDRLTRKLDGQDDGLAGFPAGDPTAYGIELEEGILWRRVVGVGAGLFVGCVALGVLWSVMFRDVSAGFTIASCLVALEVFMLSLAVQSFERLVPVYPAAAG